MIYLYCLICFVLEVITSYLANWVNVSIIARKKWKASYCSLLKGTANWAIFCIVGKLSNWNYYIMAASVIGETVGDYIVADRKLKKPDEAKKVKKYKSYYVRKVPFTNA